MMVFIYYLGCISFNHIHRQNTAFKSFLMIQMILRYNSHSEHSGKNTYIYIYIHTYIHT